MTRSEKLTKVESEIQADIDRSHAQIAQHKKALEEAVASSPEVVTPEENQQMLRINQLMAGLDPTSITTASPSGAMPIESAGTAPIGTAGAATQGRKEVLSAGPTGVVSIKPLDASHHPEASGNVPDAGAGARRDGPVVHERADGVSTTQVPAAPERAQKEEAKPPEGIDKPEGVTGKAAKDDMPNPEGETKPEGEDEIEQPQEIEQQPQTAEEREMLEQMEREEQQKSEGAKSKK